MGTLDYVQYWENRYKSGATSGAGSYGHLALWKAEIVNKIYQDESPSTVLEFGCGDGAQLGLYQFSSYVGLDVSERAVDLCKETYRFDYSKQFQKVVPGFEPELPRADLVICIEVLMHITDDDDYEWTLKNIFEHANRLVLILNPLGGQLQRRRSRHEADRNLLVHLQPFLADFSIDKVILHPSVSRRNRALGDVGDLASDFVLLRRRKGQTKLRGRMR